MKINKTVRIILYALVGLLFFSMFVSLFSRCTAGDGNKKPPASSPSISTPGEDEGGNVIEVNSSKSLNEWLEGETETVTLTMQSDMQLAMANEGATVLGAGGVTIDGNNKTLTVTGAVKGVIQANENSTLMLKNLTVNDETTGGVYSDYLGFGGKIRFENCTFTKGIYLKNDIEAAFVGCLFNVTDTQRYSAWVADGNASFENCTFTGARALKIHEFEGGDDIQTVSVNNCTFRDLTEKPGVVIGDIIVNPTETTVSVKNSVFTNCNAWDNIGSIEGVDGFYETDTFTSEFNFVAENNTVNFTPKTYNIVYYAIIDGGEPTAIPDKMYKSNGSYPTSYLGVNGATIDDLQDYGNYEFQGWYLDEECATPFDGTIDEGGTRQVVLYAKIIDLNNDIYWTPNY